MTALLLFAGLAQGQSAQLSGFIRDQSGGAIPDAEVSARNEQTGGRRTTQSNDAGIYSVPSLKPGIYRVSIQANNFETAIREGVRLEIDESGRLDFTLRVGPSHTAVTVANDPTQSTAKSGLAGIELSNAALGGVQDSSTIRELPLNGRDWTQLSTLEPGVTPIRTQLPVGAARGNRGFGTQVSVLGMRPFQNSYRMDGIIQNDYANSTPGSALGLTLGVDAIEEFSVLTGGYDATYGMVSSGVINAITRSGTNSFHGDVYEFLRNDALDARNFFDKSTKPPFRRNQFGVSAGGPIWKDRTFIFADYEGLRQSQTTTQTATVLSENARVGQLASGNIAVSPAVKPFLALWPLPNSGLLGNGDTGLFTFASRSITPENFGATRVDSIASHTDSFSISYMFDSATSTSPDALNVVNVINRTSRQTGSVEELHIFGPQALNTLRLGVNRVAAQVLSTQPGANQLGTDTSLGAWPGKTAPQISVPGITAVTGGTGGQAFSLYYFTTYQFYDDVVIQRGVHSIKFGASGERFDDNLQLTGRPTGEFDFNSLSDFLANRPSDFFSDIPGGTTGLRGLRQTAFGTYFQDSLSFRSNLSLNVGLRYEPTTVPNEAHSRLANLDSLFSQEITVGKPYFSNPTLHNIAPRTGLAWDPSGSGAAVVRASFGIYDVLPLVYQFNFMQGYSAPFFQFATIDNPPPGSFPIGAAESLAANPLRLRASTVEQRPPRNYVIGWNLSVEHSLSPNLSATAAYVGSHSVHMIFIANDANFVIPVSTPEGYIVPVNGTVANPKFGEIRSESWSGSASYSALLVKVHKRMSHGIQIQGAFTWGKSIDTSSSDISAGSYGNTVNSLFIDNKLNRALSDFNVGRNIVINGLWKMPGAQTGFAGLALAGWELGGIWEASDGFPFTPLIAGDPLGLQNDVPYDVPDRVADGICTHLVNPGQPSNYINVGCYSFPQPTNRLGNSGRNSLIGPGLANIDLALIKSTPIRANSDALNLQLRLELFNAANHANFGLPSNQLFNADGSRIASAGLITSTITSARQLQIGLKLLW